MNLSEMTKAELIELVQQLQFSLKETHKVIQQLSKDLPAYRKAKDTEARDKNFMCKQLSLKQELEKQEAKAPEGVEHTRSCAVYLPSVDILEAENDITLAVDVPGVDENTVDITLEKNVLTIHGGVTLDIPEKFKAAREEYCVGDYERKFTISHEVDSEGIKASVKDGVLRITLPKSEKAKTKKIAVTTA